MCSTWIFLFKKRCVCSFLWQIPLTYVTSDSNAVHRFLLKTRHGERVVQADSPST